ncbi:MAG: TadE/TadG family type IV pilus assembly protein [candidate division WOR-3 bacterium]
MSSASIGHKPGPGARHRFPRPYHDPKGTVLLETVIVLPVLLLFTMAIMELCLMANAKQLANYAAFCAARTLAVYGLGQAATEKAHLAAALATSTISPRNAQNTGSILSAYGLSNPDQTIATVCSIPGFQGGASSWQARLANAYVRTGLADCDTGTAPGKTRKHVTVDVIYIHRCSVFPFGCLWGHAGLNAYIASLQALPFYPTIAPAVILLANAWRWNIPIHGRAVTDYWAG